MNSKKRKTINQIANTILEALEIDSAPVSIEDIPKKLGGTLLYESIQQDGKDIEAMIRKKGENFEIIISPEVHPNRRRFSIAHELGHLFIHMGYLIDEDKWKQTVDYRDSVYYRLGHNSEEYEANEFAGALLMPEKEFIIIAKENLSNGKYSLDPIADYFQVSVDAVRTRGRWLGIFSWS